MVIWMSYMDLHRVKPYHRTAKYINMLIIDNARGDGHGSSSGNNEKKERKTERKTEKKKKKKKINTPKKTHAYVIYNVSISHQVTAHLMIHG